MRRTRLERNTKETQVSVDIAIDGSGQRTIDTPVPFLSHMLDAFARHVESQLPAYARPIFLRVREELEVTGTFKQVKSELRRQGFDPSLVDEPLFFMPARTSSYAALTGDQYRAISSGELRF